GKMAPPPPPPGPPPALDGFSAPMGEENGGSMNGPIAPVEAPQAATTTADGGKAWERAWSVEEIRKGAGNWSLSGDAGLLLYLQEFSQRMIARTHEIEQQVDGLVNETKATGTKVHNVFNEFIMLANTQFVENRVYDEDVNQEDNEVNEKKDEKEKTREEKEAEIIPKISEAVGMGINVIENAFEKLDVNAGQSDSDEDDDNTYKTDPILEPKDLYLSRPLPYLIGSAQFAQDDNVGLVESLSEDESESDQGSISETEDEDSDIGETKPGITVSDSESEYTTETGSETDSDEDGDMFKPKEIKENKKEDLFGAGTSSDEISEDELDDEPPKKSTLQSELASKLKLPSKQPDSSEDEEEIVAPPKETKKEKKKRADSVKKEKSKQKGKKEVKQDDDLFGAPEDDDPFSSKGGLFSNTGAGLFDDDNDTGGGGLFDDIEPKVTKKTKKVQEEESSEEEDEVVQEKPKAKESQTKTKSGKKVPAGGISIFGAGDDDLFPSKAKAISDNEDDYKEKPPPMDAPSKAKASGGGIFDDDDDDDLFASVPAKKPEPKKKEPAKKKTVDLFADDDDEDDDGDLFATAEPVKKESTKPKDEVDTAQPPHAEKKEKKKPKKKLPAGAVSMFGNAPNPLAAAIKAQRKQDSDASDEDDWSDDEKPASRTSSIKSGSSLTKPNGTKPIGTKESPSPSASSNSLFENEPEDDLFAKPPPVKQASKPKATSGGSGLFDDDDEDLFSPSTTTSKPAKPQTKTAPVSKPKVSGDLFGGDADEDEDDLFATAAKPKDSGKKKPPGGVSLFGGADLFGSIKPKEDVKPDVKPEPKLEKKRSNTVSMFDDDEEDKGDLFATSKPKPAVTKETTPKTEVKEPQKQRTRTKSVFEDEDILFGRDEADPNVDLFGSTSPLASPTKPDSKPFPPTNTSLAPPSRTNSLKLGGATVSSSNTDLFAGVDDDDDDDLFGTGSKTKGSSLFRSSSVPQKPISKVTPRPSKIEKVEEKPTKSDDLFGGGVDDNDEDLFASKPKEPVEKKPKKPVGGVSMFGAFDPSALKKKVVDEEEEAEVKKEATPAVTPQKDPLFGSPPKDVTDPFGLSPPKATGSTKPSVRDGPTPFGGTGQQDKPAFKSVSPPKLGIGKLQAGLNINPSALLPGAAPPVQEPTPSVAGFDKPAEVKTLHSANKDRAKITQKRRPPTRRARLQNTDQLGANVAVTSPTNIAPPSSSSPTDALFGDTDTSSAKPPSSSSGLPPLESLSDTTQSNTSAIKTTVTNTKNKSEENDIFASTPPDKLGTDISDPFSREPPPDIDFTPNKTTIDDDIFSTPSNTKSDTPDIFAREPPPMDDDDMFNSEPVPEKKPKKKALVVEDDDLFADASVNVKKEKKKKAVKEEVNDDIFDSTPTMEKKKKTNPVTKDEDLFQDDTDIFADIPTIKPKEKKKKKKTVATDKPAIDDTVDDIFASAASSTKTKTKKTKKKTVKDKDIMNNDAPSIFDDPLNAMGQ
ncbi:unnamed protein product, partial [Owenia fusiformis]